MDGEARDPGFEFVDDSALPELLPVFPLPNVVLFPNMALPLHIFEERYRRMVGDCLAGRRLLGMLLYRAGWESAEDPVPYEVGGLGQIARAIKLPMGNYDIVLRGLGRVRVIEYVQVRPYRIARVEYLEERAVEAEVAEVLGRELADRLKRIAALRPAVTPLLPSLALLAGPRDLCNFVAGHYDGLGVHERQEILEAVTVEEQLRRLLRYCNRDLAGLN
jgi:Lon protease-like protein